MLQYLQNHSRSDITYVVSQCARFVHGPKRGHEGALIQIGQYLKGTIEQGLKLKPSGDLKIHCFVDTDFAGLWSFEDKKDPICVKSRLGMLSASLTVQSYGVAASASNLNINNGSRIQHIKSYYA
jgi:hypothetical protein